MWQEVFRASITGFRDRAGVGPTTGFFAFIPYASDFRNRLSRNQTLPFRAVGDAQLGTSSSPSSIIWLTSTSSAESSLCQLWPRHITARPHPVEQFLVRHAKQLGQ